MQFSRIKNVFIIALLLVNIFLLILVIPQVTVNRDAYTESGEELEALFSGRGITLDWHAIPQGPGLYELYLTGDEKPEQDAALLLLGSTMLMDDASSLVSNLYEGEKGRAEFHKSGAFTVTIAQPETAGTNLAEAAKRLLTDMGFVPYGDLTVTHLSAGRYTVAAVQALEGAPVYSSSALLSYDNYCLTAVSGVWYSTYEGKKGAEASVSAQTALVSFLSSQNSLGWLCTSVEAVSQGYIEEATPSLGAAKLIPVWRIATDTGDFYVNGLTREVTAAG